MSKAFVLYPDALGHAVGAVFTHKGKDEKEHPTAFAIRTLHVPERKYSSFE